MLRRYRVPPSMVQRAYLSSRVPLGAGAGSSSSNSLGTSGRGGTTLQRAGDSALRFELPPVVSPLRSRALKVCIIGPTNAGKSTLLNALLDRNVAAVSSKIHTTRENTIGYLTDPETSTQVEFLDAPGSLGPDVPALHREIWEAISRAELALIVVDGKDERSHNQVGRFLRRLARELREAEREAMESTAQHEGGGGGSSSGGGGDDVDVGHFASDLAAERPLADQRPRAERRVTYDSLRGAGTRRRLQTALVLNKTDLVKPKGYLLKASRKLHEQFAFDWPAFMVSAKHGDKDLGVRDLRSWLINYARPGEWTVPQGVVQVQPPLVRATELIREQIFKYFQKELPYVLEQRNLGWTELSKPEGALRIDQELLLPTDGCSPGKRKSMQKIVQKKLPLIATAARRNLRDEFERIVFLNLHLRSAGQHEESLQALQAAADASLLNAERGQR